MFYKYFVTRLLVVGIIGFTSAETGCTNSRNERLNTFHLACEQIYWIRRPGRRPFCSHTHMVHQLSGKHKFVYQENQKLRDLMLFHKSIIRNVKKQLSSPAQALFFHRWFLGASNLITMFNSKIKPHENQDSINNRICTTNN